MLRWADLPKAIRIRIAALAALTLVGAGLVSLGVLHHGRPAVLGSGSASAIPGSYIVRLKDIRSVRVQGVAVHADRLSAGHHGVLGQVWDRPLRGFSVAMSEADAQDMAAEPEVAYVEQSQRMGLGVSSSAAPAAAAVVESAVNWGLDRVDQRALPLNQSYLYDESAGAGVRAYIVDSGLRITHSEFGGRAGYGPNFVNDGRTADDCDGHGTAIAGIVGGAHYGVAKKVRMVGVRVFNCAGMADETWVVNGINWVIHNAIRPAVMNMSMSKVCVDAANHTVACPPGAAQAVVDAEKAAIAAGIPVVAAAGNQNQDACNEPVGSADGVISVGATTIHDTRHGSSNFGRCVDIWAPGEDLVSAGRGSDVDTKAVQDTSMAAPFVTGAIALLMGTERFAAATPGQLRDQLLAAASTGVLGGLDSESPNRLLFTAPPLGAGASALALARGGSGRLALFGVAHDGGILVRTQKAANSPEWDPWVRAAAKGWSALAVEPNANGRLQLVAVTAGNGIWDRRQAAATDDWLSWSSVDGQLRTVAVAANADGSLEMIGANPAGQVFHRRQTAPGASGWGPWRQYSFSGTMTSVAAARNAAGRIEVVGVDSAGTVWRTVQASANSPSWTVFARLVPAGGAKPFTEVALAANEDGTLELLGTDGGTGVWHSSETGATWSSYAAVGPAKALTHIAADAAADGRVVLVGVDSAGDMWQAAQTAPNALTYAPWTQLGP